MGYSPWVAESDTTEHTHTMPLPPSTFIPDQTLSLCRDYFCNLILRFLRLCLGGVAGARLGTRMPLLCSALLAGHREAAGGHALGLLLD